MNRDDVFRILGIERTKDERQIKDAYRKRLMKKNPEDDPEGFKELRTAYEEALRFAGEEEAQEAADQTPSGLFAAKAAEIYSTLSRRINVKEWEALFDEDVFFSLEEEENCRIKLLTFMMDHYRFPTDVWKLFGKRLGILSDTARLRERFPADYIGFLISRCDQGDELEYDRFEGPETGDYDTFIKDYELAWRAISEERFDDAGELIQSADALGITHPAMEVCKGQLLVKTGQEEEGFSFFEKLHTKYPDDLVVNFHYAENLWDKGEEGDIEAKKKAAELFEQIKAGNDNHYMANMRLSHWYYEQKRYKDAKKCAEKLLSSGIDDDYMEFLRQINCKLEEALEKSYMEKGDLLTGLELCWCFLQDGHPTRSMRIAQELKEKVTPEKDSEWKGLICKLHIELGDYEESAECALVWRKALEKRLLMEEYADERERDEDRIRQSYLIRMQCFHNLGYVDPAYFAKSIAEGEEVLSGGLSDIQVLMEMGQVYAEMGEYEKAESIAFELLGTYQVSAANVILIETGRRQLNAATVVNAGMRCIEDFPDFSKAYESVAKVYLDLNCTEEFHSLLEKARENHVESVLLEAYEHLLSKPDPDLSDLNEKIEAFRTEYRKPVENGEMQLYEKGLKVVTGYLYDCPDDFMLVERAIYYKSARKYTEAKADYEKALVLRPNNAYALNGLSYVYRALGDFDKALFFLKKAILYGKEEFNPIIYTDLAEVYSQLGAYEKALETAQKYEEGLENMPTWFVNQLVEIYENLGDADKACELCTREKEKYPDRSFQDQIDACVKAGQYRRAEKILAQRAAELRINTEIGLVNALRLSAGLGSKEEAVTFWKYFMWLYLVQGDGDQVRKALRQLANLTKGMKANYGVLYDCTFGAFCIRDKKLAKYFGNQLSMAMTLNHTRDEKKYFQSGKKYQTYRFFAALPKGDRKELEEILRDAENCAYCNACTEQGCVELASAKIIVLLLFGEKEAARELYEGTKRTHVGPPDWNMLALGASFFRETNPTNEH